MALAVRVIPCLDVDAGRVVKGVHFENLRDAGDPVELAAEYYRQGADELTFLDVTASSGHRRSMVDVVRQSGGHQHPVAYPRYRRAFRQPGSGAFR